MKNNKINDFPNRIKFKGKQYLTHDVIEALKKINKNEEIRSHFLVYHGNNVIRFFKHFLTEKKFIYLLRQDGDNDYYFCDNKFKIHKIFNMLEFFQKEEERDAIIRKKIKKIEQSED